MKKIVFYVLEAIGCVFTYLGTKRAESKRKKRKDNAAD